jgi:hypothetical protein
MELETTNNTNLTLHFHQKKTPKFKETHNLSKTTLFNQLRVQQQVKQSGANEASKTNTPVN